MTEDKMEKGETKRKKAFAQGYNFYKIVWLFVIGAFLGDIVETIFCRFSMGRWMSRSSVLYGPFSVVWGFGVVLLSGILHRFKKNDFWKIFLTGTLLGGVYEYICSLFTENIFGAKFWNYSKIPFNIQGRINVLFCLFWGVAAILWVRYFYPALSGKIEQIPRKIGRPLTWCLAVFMAINMGLSSFALNRAYERHLEIPAQSAMERFLDRNYQDEKIKKIYPLLKFVEETPESTVSGQNTSEREISDGDITG